MRATSLCLGAAALGLASAWSYPDCDHDNCYNELTDARFAAEAKAFCPIFLAGTTTAASAIPTDFGNCAGDVKAVSSACSCITYVPSTTTTSTTSQTPTSSSSSLSTYTTSKPTSSPYSTSSTLPISTYTTSWSTSTVYTTTVRTVTSCAPSVSSCPGRQSTTVTTEIIAISTTVCPVTVPVTYNTQPPPPVTTVQPTTYPASATPTKATTSSKIPVTAGAGRVGGGFGAAAAAVVAAVFL